VSQIRNYVDMSLTELSSLDRQRTCIFMSVSPIEVHGPHLPVGTDVLIAEEVKRRLQRELGARHPDLILVDFPPLYCGADPVPFRGSIAISPKALSDILYSYGRDLATQGFRYLVVTDNHGGPRHQLAIHKAIRKLWEKHTFYLIDPFILIYKNMVRHDPDLLASTRLTFGTCGDDADNHAGTNETSLVLAAQSKEKDPKYQGVAPSRLPEPKGTLRVLARLARFLEKMGTRDLGPDLSHLANTLAWVGQKPLVPYLGDPNLATRERGDAMLNYHVKVSLELVEKALSGQSILEAQKPMLAPLSFLA